MDSDTPLPEHIRSIPQFVKENPNFTLGQLRHMAHHSATNGLDACGALIRVYPTPDSKRARVSVVVPRLMKWFVSGGARAAA
jgi:hypothetical protein